MTLSNRINIMSKKQKLELTWIGKDKRPRLEPRILLEDKALSYRATEKDRRGSEEDLRSEDLRGSEADLRGFQNLVGLNHHDNLLIHGDNLLALKALEQRYAGKVKCVFIDPPYNTGSAFTHYDDGVEHSLWLSLMRDRLEAIVPRLKKVIDGEDQGGISKAVNWQGGGFRYFRLAPSLLKKDSWGNWIINKAYNAEMLSETMCKHMGYIYAPSQEIFWQHGYATENSYIYVTTGTLGHDQLKLISSEIGTGRSLLICCKGFMANTDEFSNLTLKKIPKAVLHKCEWDHDDYSFAINVLPDEQDAEGDENE